MFKNFFCLVLTSIVLLSGTIVPTYAFTPTNFDVAAEGAYLMSFDTGDVLYAKNEHAKMYPASLTKLMTSLILVEYSTNVETETIPITRNAVVSLLGTGSSVAGLKEGEIVTVKDMLHMLLMSSANDGANAIAEMISGSNEEFAKLMNNKAKQIGMISTNFVNPHGLQDDNHYTTSYDMAILAKKVLENEVLADVVSKRRYTKAATNLSPSVVYSTTNMLVDSSTAYYYKNAIGMKTGFTDEAGRCLISAARKDGYTYICVLMKSPILDENGFGIRKEFGDSKKLFEWALNDFEYKQVVNSEQIAGEMKVDLAWDSDYVSYASSNNLSAIIPKNADASTITLEFKLDYQSVDAPVEKGQKFGIADVFFAGEKLGTVDIIASESIERSNVLYVLRIVKNIFSSIAFKITLVILFALILCFIVACIMLNRNRKYRKRVREYRRF